MYIITLTYAFGAGREFTATFLRTAKNEREAIEKAKEQLADSQIGRGYSILHQVAFITDYGAGF